jgi:hypothetical protein
MQIQVKLKRGGRVRDSFTVEVPPEIERFDVANGPTNPETIDSLDFAGVRIAVAHCVDTLMRRRRKAEEMYLVLTDDRAMLAWLKNHKFMFAKGDCFPVVRAEVYGRRGVQRRQELLEEHLHCLNMSDRPVLMRSAIEIMWEGRTGMDNAVTLFRRYVRRRRYTCTDAEQFHREMIALGDRLDKKRYWRHSLRHRPYLYTLWSIVRDAGMRVGGDMLVGNPYGGNRYGVWITGQYYEVDTKTFDTLKKIHEMIALGENAA